VINKLQQSRVPLFKTPFSHFINTFIVNIRMLCLYAGEHITRSMQEKLRVTSEQHKYATFEFDEDDEDSDGEQIPVKKQRSRWEKKRVKTLGRRRPNLLDIVDLVSNSTDVGASLQGVSSEPSATDGSSLNTVSAAVEQLTGLMQDCWADQPADRPLFPVIVRTVRKVLSRVQHPPALRAGAAVTAPGRLPWATYTLYDEQFAKFAARFRTDADGAVGIEAANSVFASAVQRLEQLLKAACTAASLPFAGRGGLGTYVGVLHAQRAFPLDVYTDLSALVKKRNLVTHEGMLISVALAHEYCVVCSRVLRALRQTYFAGLV
jgi:hypothetical protein